MEPMDLAATPDQAPEPVQLEEGGGQGPVDLPDLPGDAPAGDPPAPPAKPVPKRKAKGKKAKAPPRPKPNDGLTNNERSALRKQQALAKKKEALYKNIPSDSCAKGVEKGSEFYLALRAMDKDFQEGMDKVESAPRRLEDREEVLFSFNHSPETVEEYTELMLRHCKKMQLSLRDIGIKPFDYTRLCNFVYTLRLYCPQRRKSSTGTSRSLCAKNIMPSLAEKVFLAMELTGEDIFWDLGSGDGTVAIQAAIQAGSPVFGVEIQEPNHILASAIWNIILKHGETLGWQPTNTLQTINDDIAKITDHIIGSSYAHPNRPKDAKVKMWYNNKLMPPSLDLEVMKMFLYLPIGSRLTTSRKIWDCSESSSRSDEYTTQGVLRTMVRETVEVQYAAEEVEWAAPGEVYMYRKHKQIDVVAD